MARDERGTTLTELIVGMFAGVIVFAGVTTLIMVTLHTSSRVSARVHTTQDARLTLTKVIDQLHSACIAPKIAPIKLGSTGSELRFVHATGAAVSPTPTETRIIFAEGKLTQYDYAWKSGVAPGWVFETLKPSHTAVLGEGISQNGSKPIFTYYRNTGGTPSAITAPIDGGEPGEAIQVTVAFMASPVDGTTEAATPTRIQGSATLRLTATSYNPAAIASPCQ